jgi:hypothetical protein
VLGGESTKFLLSWRKYFSSLGTPENAGWDEVLKHKLIDNMP